MGASDSFSGAVGSNPIRYSNEMPSAAQYARPASATSHSPAGSNSNQISTAPQSASSGWFSDAWSAVSGFVSDMFDGAVKGNYSEKSDTSAAVTGQIATGLIPFVGQAADARDTVAAYQKLERGEDGAGFEMALTLAGWVPFAGDWIKGAGKTIGKRLISTLENSTGFLKRTAKSAFKSVEEAASNFKKNWFYHPEIETTPFLQAGEGQTDAFGNVLISSLGSKTEQELVYHHEMVHQFLSPKFLPLQEFRATARMSAYQKSSLCRYIEEALAESYAQVKVNGLSALPTGLKFPISNGYVELKDVITEAAAGSVVVGGVTYGVYVTAGNGSGDPAQ